MPVHVLPDGAPMSYAETGAGAPIVLVHGWAAHGGFFTELATHLTNSHRVFVLTLRGHPGSGQGASPLTIETLADDIAHFFNALGLKRAIALGWSMGAMAVWAAQPRIAESLSGLVIEDMAPRIINDAAWSAGISGGYSADDVPGSLSEINADWPAYVSRFAPRMFAPEARETRPDLVTWATNEMMKANADAMSAFWKSMAAQDFRSALARIATPMLAIHGGESQVYPDEATAFVAHTAPNAKRIVIPGAGHVPHLETPDEFLTHLEAFVRETRRSELRSGGAVP